MAGDDDQDHGELLVLQHHDLTCPDQLTPVLDGRAGNRPWRLVRIDRDGVPALDAIVRGVLVLGGPMGVQDRDAHAWIEPELDFLRRAVDAGVPVFGICLGAQLLATALGGGVTRRAAPEVGVFSLHRTLGGREDQVFAGWPDGGQVLLSHEDEASTLPDGAIALLQGSDGVPAWRTGDGCAYGVQFHPETGPDLLQRWLEDPGLSGMVAAAGVDPDALLADVRTRAAFLRSTGVALVARWLDTVVGAGGPPPRRRRAAAT